MNSQVGSRGEDRVCLSGLFSHIKATNVCRCTLQPEFPHSAAPANRRKSDVYVFPADSIHHSHPCFRLRLPPWGPPHLHWAPQVSQPFVTSNIWWHVSAECGIHTTFNSLISVHQRRECRRCPTSPSLSCTPCTFWQLSLATWPLKVRAVVPGTVLQVVFTYKCLYKNQVVSAFIDIYCC